MTVEIFDARPCSLGEGPLWHPARGQLFWFDINEKRLLTKTNGQAKHWQFSDHVSAAGWISETSLLIASEIELFTFDLETEARQHICPLEADNPDTRSNDGRADPWGGFWIGTMGKQAEENYGAIYRYYEGGLQKLFDNITISNSICFSPDKNWAYYTDTIDKHIMRVKLDAEGWPTGTPEIYVDVREEGLCPDGSVVDSDGYLWNAQWGASRVARYAPDGRFTEAIRLPATQITCPAFGGDNLTTLFATSAYEGLSDPADEAGATFSTQLTVSGLPEYRVKL